MIISDDYILSLNYQAFCLIIDIQQKLVIKCIKWLLVNT